MTTPEHTDHRTSSTSSKILVVVFVLLILGGAALWNAWDYFGTEGLSPKLVKEMANVYEQECYAEANDIKACKRHMGLRHRLCMKEGIERDTPKSAPRYNQEAYSACMRVHRAEDLANLERKKPAAPAP